MSQRLTYNQWTEDEEVYLEELRMQGLDLREIARRMGRSYGSVHGKLYHMKLLKPCTRAMMYADLFRCQHTLKQVADAMGVKLQTARAAKVRLKKAGVKVVAALGNLRDGSGKQARLHAEAPVAQATW